MLSSTSVLLKSQHFAEASCRYFNFKTSQFSFYLHGLLVGAVVERWTRDRKVSGSTSQLGQLSLPSLRGR